jgi:hypothetical protein
MPFLLTVRFKALLHRGIELASLDMSHVCSFLVLALGKRHVADDATTNGCWRNDAADRLINMICGTIITMLLFTITCKRGHSSSCSSLATEQCLHYPQQELHFSLKYGTETYGNFQESLDSRRDREQRKHFTYMECVTNLLAQKHLGVCFCHSNTPQMPTTAPSSQTFTIF